MKSKLLICGVLVSAMVGIIFISDCAQKSNLPADDDLKAVEPISNLKNFTSDEELEAYLKEQLLQNTEATDYWSYPFDGDLGLLSPEDEGSIEVGEDYSTTNIQEEGVDESDVVKTDGTYLYIAVGSEVKVISAVPAEAMAVLSTIPVQSYVDSLYLYEDLLVVLYQYGYYDYYYYTTPVGGIPEERPYAKMGVLLVDITDPASPVILREMLFEGIMKSSRLTGGRLHLIQQFRPYIPNLRYWYTEEDHTAIKAHNQEIINGLTLDDMIPAYYELDEGGTITGSGRAVEPIDFCRPVDPEGSNIIIVVTIDLKDLSSNFRSLAAVADVNIVYASTRALYLAHTIWSHTSDPQPRPLVGYDYSEQTVVRKFDLTAERVRNVASGRVWGHVLNQFSLGEHEDVLRIATTTGFTWATGERSSRNHIFCLAKRTGAHLEIIGSIENMAPGERIYSARFLGERGFLVTFKQVDPLFTLDLSDPESPRVVGELKVPGYSDYIHPLGENHLLTIGKDTDEFALYQGVQLSVFDVTDFADPTLLHKEIIGSRGTESEALHNHKAFTFWAERDLLAIPIYLCEGGTGEWSYGTHTFTGLYVYRVTVEDGVEFQGRISIAPVDPTYYYYWPEWTRGVFISDNIYAATSEEVKAAALDDIGGTVWSLGLGD